jgi:hypothetical protein
VACPILDRHGVPGLPVVAGVEMTTPAGAAGGLPSPGLAGTIDPQGTEAAVAASKANPPLDLTDEATSDVYHRAPTTPGMTG